MSESIEATVLITTKDRKEDLRRAVRSAVEQTVEVEVLVVDDGSSDGTSKMIRNEFPSVRVCQAEEPAGYIVRRNEGARQAKAPIIFSIDDDAEFSSPYVVEQTLQAFDSPRVGAVAIPYVDVKKSTDILQRAPDAEGRYCTFSFRGTAHALRRDLFLRLGGYREHLVHQGEEMDYCIRMLDAGYVVRLGHSDIINHYESPKRSFERMDHYGRRNDILFVWHNVPGVAAAPYMVGTAVNGIRAMIRSGRPHNMISGMAAGIADCVKYYSKRNPVALDTFRLYRRLKTNGPLPYEDVRSHL